MCADWLNTFQAFYIYVKETRFTIIGKVNVQSESSSIMNARRLQELGCLFEISGARFDRPMMKDTWELLIVFIMVCSWDLIMVGLTEKFWAWKPESDGGPPWLHSCNVYHFFYNIIKREKHHFPFAFGWVIGPSSCMLPSAHLFEFFSLWINRSPSSGKLQNVFRCYSEWHLSTCS